jgi:hypothetical protein
MPFTGQQDSGKAARRTVAVYGKAKPKIGRVNILKGGNRAYPSGSIQPVGPVEGQSSKIQRGPSPAPAFRLTFCSGELFVLARCWFRVHIIPIAARYRGSYR